MKKRPLVVLSILLSLILTASACSKGPRPHYSRADRLRFIKMHGLDKLPASDIPLEVNERVIAWMDYFSGSGARHFRRYLERSGKYIPMMHSVLREYGLPKDLVYVAMIESGFNTHARSHASAVGPWQFIRSTARRYGLRVDSWVDERRDPVKSTHAAARYLRDMYREFGHWYLAMAGYNAGEGRVARAIRESGSKNFWVHADPSKKYLKAETRDYVPKYIAAHIMAKMPKEFGFGNVNYQKPDEYEIVTVPSQTDLEVIAKCAGTDRFYIEQLNPEIRLAATPPGVRNYKLRLPKGKKERFLVAYAKVPREERIKLVVHRVKRREKLSTIARKYGVSTRALARANGISRKARVRTGTELIIPIGAAYKTRVARYGGSGGGGRKSVIRYKVRSGDTVGGIARRYGVTVKQIKRWNKLNKRGTIRIGQRLKIYTRRGGGTRVARRGSKSRGGGDVSYHRVRSGETLWTIANKYDVSVSDLRRWNNIKGNRIKPKQKLMVRSGASPTPTASTGEKLALNTASGESGTHVLAEGQTLGHVAEMYGVSTKDIMRWNNIKNPRRVRAGKKLVIKGGGKKAPAAASAPTTTTTTTATTKATTTEVATKGSGSKKASSSPGSYVLAEGQTLGHVAEMYGVSTKDLMRWNNIKNPRRVRAGRKLVIKGGTKRKAVSTAPAKKTRNLALAPKESIDEPVEDIAPPTKPTPTKSTTYKIKSGDSLWTIARKHNVSVSDIKKWNGMGESNKIKPGQKIVIKK